MIAAKWFKALPDVEVGGASSERHYPRGKSVRFQTRARLPFAVEANWRRRANYRHIPVERQAWITWKSRGKAKPVPAQLLDISRGGAAVEVDGEVPPNNPLLLGLVGPHATEEFLEATVVRFVATPSGDHRLHLAFTRPCPEDLLKRAVFGARGAVRHPWLVALGSLVSSFTKNLQGTARD